MACFICLSQFDKMQDLTIYRTYNQHFVSYLSVGNRIFMQINTIVVVASIPATSVL